MSLTGSGHCQKVVQIWGLRGSNGEEGFTLSKIILSRLLTLVPVLMGLTIFVFLMMHMLPGDPAEYMVGVEGSQEDIERIRTALGLDKPLYIQYGRFIKNILSGNLGRSIITNRPVIEELVARFPLTVQLATTSMLIATLMGLSLGTLAAVTREELVSGFAVVIGVLGLSIPSFWLGLELKVVFSVWLGWLPSIGAGGIRYLMLPSIPLGIASGTFIMLMTRRTMLDTLIQDFIRTARSKGQTEWRVVWVHGLRNALIPIITIMGVQFGYLLGGTVVIESVFSYPGIGLLIIDSILKHDFPVVQGAMLLVGTCFIILNAGVDMLYSYIDPRIRRPM
jgi:peptide/nickel transport system permease protein